MRSAVAFLLFASLGVFVGGCDLIPAELAGLSTPAATATPSPTPSPSPSPTPTPSPTPSPTPESFELRAAIDQGIVTAKGSGDGLQWLDLQLTSKVDRAIEITVEPGTIFEPKASATQTMVLINAATIDLDAQESNSWSLKVACVEMRQHQPASDDHFTVEPNLATGDLAALLALPAFNDEAFRVQQFAIWTITDNPRRNGYVALGTATDVFGTKPSDDEIDAVRQLFESAGIDTSKYRALR